MGSDIHVLTKTGKNPWLDYTYRLLLIYVELELQEQACLQNSEKKIIAECSLSFNNMKCIHQVDDVVFFTMFAKFCNALTNK